MLRVIPQFVTFVVLQQLNFARCINMKLCLRIFQTHSLVITAQQYHQAYVRSNLLSEFVFPVQPDIKMKKNVYIKIKNSCRLIYVDELFTMTKSQTVQAASPNILFIGESTTGLQ